MSIFRTVPVTCPDCGTPFDSPVLVTYTKVKRLRRERPRYTRCQDCRRRKR